MESTLHTWSKVLLIPVLLCLASCASSPAKRTSSTEDEWTIVQPYHRPLAGMGGGAILGSVPVPQDQEAELASRALVMALQKQQLSVVEPELGLDGMIPSNTQWSTDIAPLPVETITAYNQAFAQLATERRYGISYSGLHDTHGDELRYRISAHLHERGSLSDWEVKGDNEYFGSFFVDKLAADISRELKSEEGDAP